MLILLLYIYSTNVWSAFSSSDLLILTLKNVLITALIRPPDLPY